MLKSKNKSMELDEDLSVGGGATGVSKVPGPVAKGNVHANRPQDKSQGDGSKIELTKVADRRQLCQEQVVGFYEGLFCFCQDGRSRTRTPAALR